MGILVLTSFSFFSCDRLEDEITEETIEVTADAGSDRSVEVGEQVTLDGTNSSVNTGTLSFRWEMISRPEGSTVQLNYPSTSTPFFTPDVAGQYRIEVTVTYNDQSDTDAIIVTATGEGGNGQTTKEKSGDISSDETWTNHNGDTAEPDYLITGHLNVNAKLTIDTGVLIHVKEDAGIFVTSNGTLISEGQEGSRVTITSANEKAGLLWKGIYITSNSALNKLEYTSIQYAGNSDFGFSGTNYAAAIGIEDGKLNLVNSSVDSSGSFGLFLHSGELLDFSSNQFSGNSGYAVRINAEQAGSLDNQTTFSEPDMAVEMYGSMLSSTAEITWPALAAGARYYMSGSIEVNSYLEIAAGARFDFAENEAIYVGSEGTFVAGASGGEQIVFTSKCAASDVYWKGIYVNSNDARNILNNVELSYAGNSVWGFSGTNYAGAVGIENGKLSIRQTTISNSKAHGLYFHSGNLNEFGENRFEGNANHAMVLHANEVGKIDTATSFTNNGWDGAAIYNSTLSNQSTWVNLKGDAKYRLTGWLNVEEGLTVQAGAEIAVDENQAIEVRNTGYLVAKGKADSNIVFTTSNLAGQIHWGGIWIRTSDSRNELDHVTVNYAGGTSFGFSGTNYAAAVAGDDGDEPTLTMTNTTIKNSASYAVYWEGGTINDITAAAAGNTFIDNTNEVQLPLP